MPHLFVSAVPGRALLAGALVCVSLMLAACGGNDSDSTTPSTNASTCKTSHCAPAP